ncbi:hypothetical protein IJT93_01000 [bacterium]|nr:hypothetical protein [bacterium]
MDSINPCSGVNLPTLRAEQPAETNVKTEPETAASPKDTCEFSQAPGEAQDHIQTGRLKDFAKKTKELFKEAADSPITFIKDHKKAMPAAAGAVSAGAAVAAAALFDCGKADDIIDIAQLAIFKGGVKGKVELYSKIAETTGVAAGAACIIGGGITAAIGITKAVKGVGKIARGIKKHDKAAAAKGVRSALAGTRKALTGAVVGTLNAGGVIGIASKTTRKVIMPPLRKAAAGLNIGIGVHTLVKGIQHKDKKEILTGALDLGYGTAVAASIIAGGPVTSVTCTVLLFSKEALSAGKKIAKLVKKDRDIQKDRRTEPAEQIQLDKTAAPVKEKRL